MILASIGGQHNTWKLGVVYGVGNLQKDGITGVTNNVQFRIQWFIKENLT